MKIPLPLSDPIRRPKRVVLCLSVIARRWTGVVHITVKMNWFSQSKRSWAIGVLAIGIARITTVAMLVLS